MIQDTYPRAGATCRCARVWFLSVGVDGGTRYHSLTSDHHSMLLALAPARGKSSSPLRTPATYLLSVPVPLKITMEPEVSRRGQAHRSTGTDLGQVQPSRRNVGAEQDTVGRFAEGEEHLRSFLHIRCRAVTHISTVLAHGNTYPELPRGP